MAVFWYPTRVAYLEAVQSGIRAEARDSVAIVVEGRGWCIGGDGGEKSEDADADVDAQRCGGPGNVTVASKTRLPFLDCR